MFTDQYQTDDAFLVRVDIDENSTIYLREGKSIKDDREIEKLANELEEEWGDMAPRYAQLVHQIPKWTIKLPATYRKPILDENGELLRNEDGKIRTEKHPLAGKVPPITPEWIDSMQGKGLIAIIDAYEKQYALRPREEQENFRDESSTPVVGQSRGANDG